MYPHERSLVKRLEGKPFALLGINSGDSKEQLKKALDKENITWRSWFDGACDGPIATTWNVNSWPTIFVLDEKGVIHYKNVRGEAMDKAVNTLLAKMGVKVEKEKSEEAPAKKGG
jgi:peroxiredoxin